MSITPDSPAIPGISPNKKMPNIMDTIDLYEFIGPIIDRSPLERAFTKKPFPNAQNIPEIVHIIQNL